MPANALVRISDEYLVQFARIIGEFNFPVPQLKEIAEEYVGGSAFKLMRYAADAVVMTGETFAIDDLDYASVLVDYASLVGTQCRYYHCSGFYLHGVVILDLRVVKSQLLEFAVFEGVPMQNPWKITSQITMKYPYPYF
jgi:hypothetical protein